MSRLVDSINRESKFIYAEKAAIDIRRTSNLSDADYDKLIKQIKQRIEDNKED